MGAKAAALRESGSASPCFVGAPHGRDGLIGNAFAPMGRSYETEAGAAPMPAIGRGGTGFTKMSVA